MKRIHVPILLLTLLFPSLAYGVTMEDLVQRDGLYYKKFTDVPFTGKTTGKIQGSFKNGKKHGPWIMYRNNGQLKEKGTYNDGKLEGFYVAYHNNGKLRLKTTYKNGRKHAEMIEVKPSDQTTMEMAGKSLAKKKQVVVNMAKWEAANAYAKQRKIRFRVVSEEQLFHNGKRK